MYRVGNGGHKSHHGEDHAAAAACWCGDDVRVSVCCGSEPASREGETSSSFVERRGHSFQCGYVLCGFSFVFFLLHRRSRTFSPSGPVPADVVVDWLLVEVPTLARNMFASLELANPGSFLGK